MRVGIIHCEKFTRIEKGELGREYQKMEHILHTKPSATPSNLISCLNNLKYRAQKIILDVKGHVPLVIDA